MFIADCEIPLFRHNGQNYMAARIVMQIPQKQTAAAASAYEKLLFYNWDRFLREKVTNRSIVLLSLISCE